MKIALFLWLTVKLALMPLAQAAELPPPVPVAVAESETFEAVGRLEAEGLSWFVDRAETNAPVLGATLEVEAGGKTAKAIFRPERGDYLIADADWLKALRQPGEHALALTLVAGTESDLLAADLDVSPAAAGAAGGLSRGQLTLAGVAGLLLALWALARRQKRGGAA